MLSFMQPSVSGTSGNIPTCLYCTVQLYHGSKVFRYIVYIPLAAAGGAYLSMVHVPGRYSYIPVSRSTGTRVGPYHGHGTSRKGRTSNSRTPAYYRR